MSEPMFKLIAAEPAHRPPARVYLDYYQLTEAPFAITPDPEFLFFASSHKQVLDRIRYAIDGCMGFILLTGEVGTGKTTICRTLLDQLNGNAETVYVINPSVTGYELLTNILEDMGMPVGTQVSKKDLIDQLSRHLLSANSGRPFVVIIDDAQTMPPDTLEDLRLLSNLETDKRKLIQVVLSGQQELLDKLAEPRLRQLKQRIAVHCPLAPLSVDETAGYISRRLSVAGNQGQVSFSSTAVQLIHKTSGGIPRLINKISDFSLTAGYVDDAQGIESSHVKTALAEMADLAFEPKQSLARRLRFAFPAACVGLALISILIVVLGSDAFGLRKTSLMPPVAGDPIAKSVRLSEPPQNPATLLATPAPSDEPTPSSTTGRIDEARPTASRSGVSRSPYQPAPYALQLDSFRTLARAEQSKAKYREQGVPAVWQLLEKGNWYRIVVGKFENQAQAHQFQKKHGLPDALLIKAPWSVKVLHQQPGLSSTEIIRILKHNGYDSLIETSLTGDNEVYTGLFQSSAKAASTAEQISRNDQLLAQVVRRKTAPGQLE
ncbi:MAG: AAA family ATPase [Desulfosarcina sp.]